MTPDQQLALLRSCVDLRVQGRAVPESVRLGLASIEQALVAQVGPLVRKTIAARVLGCSVQAIDRHVRAGRISTKPIAARSTRAAIPTDELLDIAFEQAIAPARPLAAAVDLAERRRSRQREFNEIASLIAIGDRFARLVDERQRGTA